MTPRLERLRDRGLAEWLDHCLDTTFAHGADLADAIGTPRGDRPGLADNVAEADRALADLEAAGWIRRLPPATPTREQCFFGVGGGRQWDAHPVCYGFKPGAEAARGRAWLRSGAICGKPARSIGAGS